MSSLRQSSSPCSPPSRVHAWSVALLLVCPQLLVAQRDVRVPAATQAFDAAECRADCLIDSLVIDIDRGRRAQAGAVNATMLLIDTISLPRRGAPAAPREQTVAVSISCDASPCAAAVLTGRVSDKRLDDARVVRRSLMVWPLPAPLLLRVPRTSAISITLDGRTHQLSTEVLTATRTLIAAIAPAIPVTTYSPRAMLYVSTFALFGIPGDSTLAEDVGTATEPLMIPDATTAPPTRVATLTFAGRGPDAIPMLVQDDATGAAPLFGVGETVTIALPGRIGRRGVVSGKIAARQRVDVMRDACQGMKVWTYLVTLSPSDLAATQRGTVPSPRSGEGIDRWSGTAVREAIAPRMSAAEQRTITASRSAIAQFVKERASSGLTARDVQVMAALPRSAGFVTNFGVLSRDSSGLWRYPTLTLRPATCP